MKIFIYKKRKPKADKNHNWHRITAKKSECTECRTLRLKLSASSTLYYNEDGFYLGSNMPKCK